MLDQSFSAHNFDIIYNIESRRGNIDIKTMPEGYRCIIAQTEEIKRIISSLRGKKDKTLSETEELENKKSELKDLMESKKVALQVYLEQIEKETNSHEFRITLKKFKASDGKEVFTINSASNAHIFAVKQLQYNIRHTFKVKQANRHNILSNIKTFLNSNIPVYIIRTDISGFYESIPHDKLLPMIMDNTLLSYKSKAFIKGIIREYESIKDTALVVSGLGVPRGIGISSYLSELYMRNLDAKIVGRRNVMFYARYVDDIFLVLSTLPTGMTLKKYYDDMTADFNAYGLSLKQPDDGSDKCKLIDFTTADHEEIKMNYLGYNLYMSRNNNTLKTSFGLSDEKKTRYKKRIDSSITHFETLSKCDVKQAYHNLIDSLNFITGNFKLFKTKSGVKVGLRYNNDLLDRLDELDELTKYLQTHPIAPYVGLKDNANIKDKLSKRIAKIDFKQRWNERKMFTFSLQRINEIEKWI